ncbi:MAG TPA: citrate synthase [Eubacteriaceae bacterium]|nr:citrate synthase [Eubacteriaceae bacterium]
MHITGYGGRIMLKKLTKLIESNDIIDPQLYKEYDVKRGLRELSGKGVMAGLTEIGEVYSYETDGSSIIPKPGQLFYRGVDVHSIVEGFTSENRHGYEETAYLLLFGELPKSDELDSFRGLLTEHRTLPKSFVRDMILKAPSKNVMNMLSRSVLGLYSYDDKADDTSIENVLRQCVKLITTFPMLAVYSYQALNHYHYGKSLVIHSPKEDYSTAENILHMLRPDSQFTDIESKLLDLSLVLHAEHGGGNNSTFSTHVISSTGTDTYSTISAALGSLKGPKHGGANIKVSEMFEDIKSKIKNWENEGEIADYLSKVLNAEEFDRSGLIYGMGHAVYSISDPRAEILRTHCKQLAEAKGQKEEFDLYFRVENIAKELIEEKRKIYKGVSANVDFYSGFVYQMLQLPLELLTPIFAISRISGWSAHRIEQLVNKGKIIRPAYKGVAQRKDYIPMSDR